MDTGAREGGFFFLVDIAPCQDVWLEEECRTDFSPSYPFTVCLWAGHGLYCITYQCW